MRRFLATLSHAFCHPYASIRPVGVLQGMLDPERDEAENWTFTTSDMSQEETVVSTLTFSCERGSDPEWIAQFCRVYKIRFADELEPPRAHTEE